jgi:hypothetical protein
MAQQAAAADQQTMTFEQLMARIQASEAAGGYPGAPDDMDVPPQRSARGSRSGRSGSGSGSKRRAAAAARAAAMAEDDDDVPAPEDDDDLNDVNGETNDDNEGDDEPGGAAAEGEGEDDDNKKETRWSRVQARSKKYYAKTLPVLQTAVKWAWFVLLL